MNNKLFLTFENFPQYFFKEGALPPTPQPQVTKPCLKTGEKQLWKPTGQGAITAN